MRRAVDHPKGVRLSGVLLKPFASRFAENNLAMVCHPDCIEQLTAKQKLHR